MSFKATDGVSGHPKLHSYLFKQNSLNDVNREQQESCGDFYLAQALLEVSAVDFGECNR